MDGAGFFGIYRNIVFPISMPGFVVVLIWQFTAIWNEFLFAVTLNSNPVRGVNANYASWLIPTSVLDPRLFKISAQFDF